MLTGTLFDAPLCRTYGDILVAERYRPAGFTAPLGLKHMTLVDAVATAHRTAMPVLGVIRDRLRLAIARESEDIDWANIAAVVKDR